MKKLSAFQVAGAGIILMLLALSILVVALRPHAMADTAYITGTTLAMDQTPCLASSPSNPLPFVANGTTVTCGSFPGDGVLSGTTTSIGGGLLVATCASGTVTITGATTSMVATTNPTTYPGVNVQWQAYVSSANTVTVQVCSSGLTLTPGASTYKVRVS